MITKNGYIDIPIDEIICKGISYVRSLVDATVPSSYNFFWNYFTKTWMHDYDPLTWNLNAFENDEDILINRTNNPLERYNRALNELLPTHPTMAVFVEGIQNEARKYVDLLENIKF